MSILGGLLVNGTIPLFYELGVESAYPIAEGLTTSVLTLINNFWCLVFLFVPSIPGLGSSTSWFMIIIPIRCCTTRVVGGHDAGRVLQQRRQVLADGGLGDCLNVWKRDSSSSGASLVGLLQLAAYAALLASAHEPQ